MKLQRIGFTHGDINGISYELLLKVMQDGELLEVCTPILFGSLKVAQSTTAQLAIDKVPFHVVNTAEEAIDGHFNLVQVCSEAEPELHFGEQTEEALKAEAQSLTAALDAILHHHIDALVTLPGHLDNADSSHSLSDFIHRAIQAQDESFDWILNGPIRTLELHHMDVSTKLGEGLASEAFMSHIITIHHHLRQDFQFIRPRIAVVSTLDKLRLDIQELREQGIMVFGPFDPKEFTEGHWQHHYDASLFLGDEAPRNQIIEEEDPQFTIGYVSGLPLVLTYPMQGISYQIAGQGKASERQLRQAIFAAIDIIRNRNSYCHATHHPLEKQWIPRGRDDFKLDLTKED